MNKLFDQATTSSVKENGTKGNKELGAFLKEFPADTSFNPEPVIPGDRLATVRVVERLGRLISSSDLQLPYDTGTPLETTSINLLNGDPTPFFGILGQADKENGELNIAALMGKWFKWNYNPLGLDFSTVITNMAKAELLKRIRFNPFNRDVFAVARITATIPSNPVTVMFTGSELPNPLLDENDHALLEGVQADFSASLSYFDGVNNVAGSKVKDTLIRSVKVQDNVEVGNIFKSSVNHSSLLKVPANTTEITFRAELLGQAFTGSDINPLLGNGNINQYALAMLDLRNVTLHANTPIIMNPYTGQLWRPSGGVKLQVKIEFYEVDNILTR